MTTTAFKKLNLPLPPEMHEALFAESKDMGVPATRLVRTVLEDWLRGRRKARRREEIRQFATACAGTELDLDMEMEAAAVEELRRFYEEEDEVGKRIGALSREAMRRVEEGIAAACDLDL